MSNSIPPNVHRLLIDTSPKARRLDPREVAEALGAEPINVKVGDSGSPLSLMQLPQDLLSRLKSEQSGAPENESR